MRYALIVLLVLLCLVSSAVAQVSIGIGPPSVSIGINLPSFPTLVVVPGYPVYYAPRLDTNLFFYDGLYWVYRGDNWYASSWYNGPWGLVAPEIVPVFVLRIPVRYYRHPPAYWVGWRSDAPPRWGEHWGHEWEQRRSGWDQWDRRSAQPPAPLPVYQRQYSGNRYPVVEQQQALRSQKTPWCGSTISSMDRKVRVRGRGRRRIRGTRSSSTWASQGDGCPPALFPVITRTSCAREVPSGFLLQERHTLDPK